MLKKGMSVFVAGHRGMVGSAIVRKLKQEGFDNLLCTGRDELDVTQQAAVRDFFKANKIDYVIIAAAKVGGIFANNEYPAEFIYQNMMIEANLINEAYQAGINGLLFLGSSCIYPRMANQPMEESALLTGELEPTNEPYAIAKIAGIKLCESYNRQYETDYRSVMPTNLYGPNDNFHPENSHVIPALIRRFHEAKEQKAECLSVWGTGQPRREFLHVDDMADASYHVMTLDREKLYSVVKPMLSHINVGSGVDITIKELAETVAKVVGYQGRIEFDPTKPDGAPRKLMNVGRLGQLGWKAGIDLHGGLANAYQWFLDNQEEDDIRLG